MVLVPKAGRSWVQNQPGPETLPQKQNLTNPNKQEPKGVCYHLYHNMRASHLANPCLQHTDLLPKIRNQSCHVKKGTRHGEGAAARGWKSCPEVLVNNVRGPGCGLEAMGQQSLLGREPVRDGVPASRLQSSSSRVLVSNSRPSPCSRCLSSELRTLRELLSTFVSG